MPLILRQQSGRVASCEQAWYAELAPDWPRGLLAFVTGSIWKLLSVYSEKELSTTQQTKATQKICEKA